MHNIEVIICMPLSFVYIQSLHILFLYIYTNGSYRAGKRALYMDCKRYKICYCERSKTRAPKASSRRVREASFACIYRNRRQHKKALKMVVDISDKT